MKRCRWQVLIAVWAKLKSPYLCQQKEPFPCPCLENHSCCAVITVAHVTAWHRYVYFRVVQHKVLLFRPSKMKLLSATSENRISSSRLSPQQNKNILFHTSPAVLVLITPPLSNPSTASPPPSHSALGASYRKLWLIRRSVRWPVENGPWIPLI